jgi:hypothetical protein
MKTNVNIIKKLARLGVLDVEQVKYKKEDDIIIKNSEGVEQKVILDGITDEDLPLMIAAEQLETTKSIKSMVKFTFVLGLVAAGIWLLVFLINLGNM